ncbi:interaptin-like [Bolinopsis microptera]|uniref:interaptin-like n=1 Tax=Bolinopsis microptera TaxID=2820187 RepID=UPI0030798228
MNLYLDEVASIRQGIREAATQTTDVVLDSVQRKLDEALTRTNSLASCGHEDLIAHLRSGVTAAEREIDMLRDVIRDRDLDQENALTEYKIDGLGDTIRDHNRSLHNLQEVLREAITSRERDASRDRPRDVIIQPRETDSTTNSEIRDIQKTLLELQYSLKHVAENQVKEKPERVREPEIQHNANCLHCTNCKRNDRDIDLEKELRKVKLELAETMNVKMEKGSLEKLRSDHTTLSIDMERMRAERNHLNEVLAQYKTQLSEIEQDKRARYHELLEINDRIAESERSMAENKATEKRAVETLRQESEELRKTISDLNLQREQMIHEAAQTQLNLKHERRAFEEEMRQKKQVFEETSITTTTRKEQEISGLETRQREREAALTELDGQIRERQTQLHQLKLEETQSERQNEMLKQQLDKQIENRNDLLQKTEEKVRELSSQIEEINEKKIAAQYDMKEVVKNIGAYKDSLSQLEREKQTMNSELQSVASKFKETETRLSSLTSELGGIVREKDSVKSELCRQQDTLETLTSEVNGLNEKKQQRKDKLKQLQEDCETLDRNIREKRSASVGHTTKKNELEKETRELESKQKMFSEQVEDISRELKSLDAQKQNEINSITELKNNFEVIKSKRGQLQDSFTVEEEKIKDCVQTMRGEQAALDENLKTLEQKIGSLDRDISLKTENLLRLSEEEERNKAILAELEMSKVSATNELDQHLNSAIKEKYALSTDITALKREKEQLKSQQATLTAELQKMRNEDALLRDKIRNDKTVCEQLQTTCANAERQYKDYCNLAEQTVLQMNNLHKNIVTVEKELQGKRSELRDSNSKLDQIQSVLQDRQEKLHLLERKLLSYAQKLTSSKTTLEENQNNISSLALQKSDLDSEMGMLKREIDSLEGSKQRTNEEVNGQRNVLDNLRKDLAACQRQHKQEMAKYNKLMREKTKYDSEVKSAKASCDSYSQNLARMKQDEQVTKERMSELSRDLAAVSQEFKEKSASLRSVEELKSQTSHLDHEIKQKSEVLSKYDEKLGEISKVKEAAMEKEMLLKDSETKVANLQNQIEDLTKTSQEKQQSEYVATTGLKKNMKKLKKHLKSQMESSSQLKKELAEQVATAKTLELDLLAQRDAHNSILATLEEDNEALHSKCEEQLLEIETLRLELTASRHNLGTKQAELTFVAEDIFNKSVHGDMDNRLAALGARDEIRNELMYSITEMNRNKRDILSDMELLRPNENIPTRDTSAIEDRKILDNINYKLNQIESTLNKDTLSSPMRTGTFADPLLTTEDSILNCTDRHDDVMMTSHDLAATGESLYKSKPRHPSLSSLENTQPRSQLASRQDYIPRSLNSESLSHPPTSSPEYRQTPGTESGRNSRITPASDQGYLTGHDPDTLSHEQDQWYNHVD